MPPAATIPTIPVTTTGGTTVTPAGVTPSVAPTTTSGQRQTAAGMTVDSVLGEPVPAGTSQSADGSVVIKHGFTPPLATAIPPAGPG